jgi:MFS family permease
MSVPAPALNQRLPHILRKANFRRWWVGAAISLFGDQFYVVALPWLILQITGSGVALGAVLTAAAAPRALLMLIGGAVSDRFSCRKIMIVAACGQAIFVGAISGLIIFDSLQLWHLYILSFAFGIADAFTFPAFHRFLPSLVRPEQLAQANSAAQSAYQVSTIAGPVAAAIIVSNIGAASAFLLDSISFLAVIAALWGLPDPVGQALPASKRGVLSEIAEGLKYVWRDSAIRTVILFMAALNFCMFGPMRVGLAYLANLRFQTSTAYGLWLSVLAAGSLVGTVVGGFKLKYRCGRLLLSVGMAIGIGVILVASSDLWIAALDLFCIGVMSGVVNVQITAWIQNRSEPSMLGRVSGVQLFSLFGFTPFSLAIAGVLAQWSINALFFAGGILMLGVTGAAAFCRPVREID